MATTDPKLRTENDALIEALRLGDKVEVFDVGLPPDLRERGLPGEVPLAVLPFGRNLLSIRSLLEEYRQRPERRTGTAKITDLASFIAHTRRFADTDSAIFANDDRARPSLTTVFDYHRIGAAADPRFGTHRAVYAPALSEEWLAWTKAEAGGAMPMADFAAFLEDRILEVEPVRVEPDPADPLVDVIRTTGGARATPERLLDLARNFKVHAEHRVVNAVNLTSGEGQINWEVTNKDQDGQPVNVPGCFVIAIPVFRLGAPYRMLVRLRHAVAGGGVRFTLKLHNADKVLDHALAELIAAAAEQTALPVYRGTPETEAAR